MIAFILFVSIFASLLSFQWHNDESLTAEASTYIYTVLNPNQAEKNYNNLSDAISNVKSNGTIRLNSNVNVSYSVTISTNTVTLDLNGYTLNNPNSGTFIKFTGHDCKIISSRANGKIYTSNGSSLPIHILGKKDNWRPKLLIGENVTIESAGDSAVINENGVLSIDGATLKSAKFYAIQQYDIDYSNQKPYTYIHNDKTKVYGIYMGKKGSTQHPHFLVINCGHIYGVPFNKTIYDTNGSPRTITINGVIFHRR